MVFSDTIVGFLGYPEAGKPLAASFHEALKGINTHINVVW